MYRLIIATIVFYLSQLDAFCQRNSQIDSVLNNLRTVYRSGEIEKAIEMSFKLLELSENADYEHGKVWSKIYIADCLSLIGDYEKSLEYINKLNVHREYFETHSYEYWLLQKTKLENYRFLGLESQFKSQFNVALETINAEPDSLKRSIALHNIYLLGAESFGSNLDSAYLFLSLAKKLVESDKFEKYNQVFVNQNKAIVYISLGFFYLKTDDIDSALVYFETAESLLNEIESILYRAELYDGLGNVLYSKEQYNLALQNKLKAAEFYKDIHSSIELERIYFELNEMYLKLDSIEIAASYLELYKQQRKENGVKKSKGIDTFILNKFEEEEMRFLKAKEKSQNQMTLVVVLCVLIIIAILIFIIKYRQSKTKVIQGVKETLVAQEQKLQTIEGELKYATKSLNSSFKRADNLNAENIELKQKFNEMFDELVGLAKRNDPNFYARFQEVYPNIQLNLLKINPSLRASELALFAYIYLGFTTKEIANLTFKSVRTIQNQKHALRKRFFLPSTEDLYVWIKQLD